MNLNKKQLSFLNVVRGWSEVDVVDFLKNNNLEEYVYFAKEKSLDGSKLLSLSDGVIAMWRPKIGHKKIINAIEDLIKNPDKYLEKKQHVDSNSKPIVSECQSFESKSSPEISKNQLKSIEKNISPPKSFLYGGKVKLNLIQCSPYVKMNGNSNIELPLIPNVDLKSQDRGYYEMTNTNEKIKLEDNPYEELNFSQIECDKKKISILKRILKQPTVKKCYTNSVGCKSKLAKIQSASISNYNINKIDLEDDFSNASSELKSYRKISECSEDVVDPKPTSSTAVFTYPEYSEINENDTFEEIVESLNYTEMNVVMRKKKDANDGKRSRQTSDYADTDILEDEEASKIGSNPSDITSKSIVNDDTNNSVQSNLIQLEAEATNEAAASIIEANKDETVIDVDFKKVEMVSEEHFYETPEMREDLLEFFYSADGYLANNLSVTGMVVEDYLEPRECFHDSGEAAIDSLAEEMMRLFDKNMMAKQSVPAFTNTTEVERKQSLEGSSSNDDQTDVTMPIFKDKPPTPKKPNMPLCSQPQPRSRDKAHVKIPPIDNHRPFDTLQKWNESLRNSVRRKKEPVKMNMAERPLPVPVENEFYYMEVGRTEAESLLEGQPDGTFILRPSSQSSHAYTVTLMYQGRIYNIGCRRRLDGRLALGFTKTTEPNFLTIHELIEYYYTEKLILLVDGKKVGSTVLKRLHP